MFIFAPATRADANLFSFEDLKPLDALRRRILAAQQDNLDIERSLNQSNAFDAYRCIGDFDNYLGEFGNQIDFISTLINLSSSMQTGADEAIVNRMVAEYLQHGLKLTPIARRSANLNAGHCGSSAIVASRAQVALSLLSEGERLLLWLKGRF